MTHDNYDALSSSWQRDEAERVQDAAMDDEFAEERETSDTSYWLCPNCDADLWPMPDDSQLAYCAACGEIFTIDELCDYDDEEDQL